MGHINIPKLGSGGEPVKQTGKYSVVFIDYDGSVIKEQPADTGDVVTFPNIPSHSWLTFQGWSCPVDITDNAVTVTDNDIVIGAYYKTASGHTELHRSLNIVTGLYTEIKLVKSNSGEMIIDWGDGTSDLYAMTGNVVATHTYTDYGDYVQLIKFADTYNIGQYITGASDVYTLTKVYLSEYVKGFENYAFYEDRSLEEISIPNSVIEVGTDCFRYDYGLKGLVLPPSITNIGNYFLDHCARLEYLALPSTLLQIGAYFVQYAYNLKLISFPVGMTRVNTNGMRFCANLRRIKLPPDVWFSNSGAYRQNYNLEEADYTRTNFVNNGCYYQNFKIKKIVLNTEITSVAASAFDQCYNCMEYDFTMCDAVPTLANVNAFNGINPLAVIKVPASLYDYWILQTNWNTLENQIVGV